MLELNRSVELDSILELGKTIRALYGFRFWVLGSHLWSALIIQSSHLEFPVAPAQALATAAEAAAAATTAKLHAEVRRLAAEATALRAAADDLRESATEADAAHREMLHHLQTSQAKVANLN